MAAITYQGERLIARKQGDGQVLKIDRIVLANIPNLDAAKPVDRNEKLPAAGQIVLNEQVSQHGHINPNLVVYSLMMATGGNDFEFNWLGLYASADDVVVAITYLPLQRKSRNVAMTRNFMLEFSGAAETTDVNIDAKSWQVDFSARMNGIDERGRQIRLDTFGRQLFYRDTCKVTKDSGGYYNIASGPAGIVAGIKFPFTGKRILIESLPNKVWLDISQQGNALSDIQTIVEVIVSSNDLVDYKDAEGRQHYVEKIATVELKGITDHRNYTFRSFSGRFNDTVNVKDFGAVGDVLLPDGTLNPNPTDDTEAFKKALAACSEGGKASVIHAPKGGYIVSDTLEIPDGVSLTGDGVDYWDTYRPDETQLLKRMLTGTHLLFKGTGAKKYSCINLCHTHENKTLNNVGYGLTDFTNRDSKNGKPATPRLFSVGLLLNKNSKLQNLRVVPWFKGIDGYNDFKTHKLADDWDVGVWAQGCNEGAINDVQSVGYWRLAGTLITENDGSYTQIGNPERLRIRNHSTTGVRGLLIRNSPQWKVFDSTSDSITVEYNETWTLTAQNKFRIIGNSVMYSFTGYTATKDKITLTGVTPSLTTKPSVIRAPSMGNNLSGTVFENSYAASLEHSSGTPSDELGLPVSGALEANGFPLRGMKFINSKMQTTFDKLNTIFGDCRDSKFIGCQFENGVLVAYGVKETAGYTSNLRFTNTYISSSCNTDLFTPRELFDDFRQFPTQFTDGSFIMKNWRNTNYELRHYNDTLLQQYRVSDGNVRFYSLTGTLYQEYTGQTGFLNHYGNGYAVRRTSDKAFFLQFFNDSGNGKCLANWLVGGQLVSTGAVRLANDNAASCGNAAYRFSEVFAVNNQINTSDETEKQSDEIPDLWLKAAALIKPIRFKWLSEIEKNKKGERGPVRWHIGYGAQSVFKVLKDAGIQNPWELAFMCKDALKEEMDDGSVVPIIDEKTGLPKERWGLRVEELNTLKLAAIERKLNQPITE